MSEVIGKFLSGDFFGAIGSLFDESPQENVREAALDILDGKKVDENMEKLEAELGKGGGDEKKLARVRELFAQLDAPGADSRQIMGEILSIVGPKDAAKRGFGPDGGSSLQGSSGLSASSKPGFVEF